MAKIIKGGGDEPVRQAPSGGPGQGIIKGEVFDASEEARRIESEAREKGASIVRAAREEADRIRENAREEGRAEAYAEANALLVKARMEREKIIASAEPQLVGLGRRIAEKIIGRELEVNPDVIVDVVRQAIQTVRQQKEIIVRVNARDLEALEKRRGDLVAVLARAKDVTLRGDPAISPGGCVVESELGTIDAQLDTQLDVIERILAGEALGG
jgi:type III secretion protein L